MALDAFDQVTERAQVHRRFAGASGTGCSVSSSQDTSGLAAMLRTTSGKYDGTRTEVRPSRRGPRARSGVVGVEVERHVEDR